MAKTFISCICYTCLCSLLCITYLIICAISQIIYALYASLNGCYIPLLFLSLIASILLCLTMKIIIEPTLTMHNNHTRLSQIIYASDCNCIHFALLNYLYKDVDLSFMICLFIFLNYPICLNFISTLFLLNNDAFYCLEVICLMTLVLTVFIDIYLLLFVIMIHLMIHFIHHFFFYVFIIFCYFISHSSLLKCVIKLN